MISMKIINIGPPLAGRSSVGYLKLCATRLQSTVSRYTERSHTCGELSKELVGHKVSLRGWVQYTRFNNKIIALKDSYGSIQCVFSNKQLLKDLRSTVIHNESVVRIDGTVSLRPDGQRNKKMPTGDIEILVDEIDIISQAKKDLPLLSREELDPVTLPNRFRFRYLDLRKSAMQQALRFRSEVTKLFRDKLYDLKFVDCETPTLFNRTPGGANEFVVPTQTKDRFYSLTQSPQQLKQLLMIGGLDRYFQITRCYRDETGRHDRQPEFTQVDLELSFTNQELVIDLMEELMHHLMSNLFGPTSGVNSSLSQSKKLRRITYKDAIEKYGTDKPDTRFGWEIEVGESWGFHLDIPHRLDENKALDLIRAAKEQVGYDEGDIIAQFTEDSTRVRSSCSTDQAREVLGRLRVLTAKELETQGLNIYDKDFEFLWVIDFPLFTVNKEDKLESNHHPFTAPSAGTKHLLDESPLNVIGQHYDLVLNGQEIAGGSIRIHDVGLQRKIFDMLGCSHNTFEYFLEALNSGCPPHGGIAVGLDRLVAILLDRETIKDVIAFPKSNNGRDLMTDCPQEIAQDVKLLYHLK